MQRIKHSFLAILTVGLLAAGCAEPESPTPTPASGASTVPARFLFVNAAPGAPQLNFFVNNAPAGTGQAFPAAQAAYTNTQPGAVQLRAKAASGQIGGTLGAADLLFRGGATNQNNFTSAGNTSYTVFVTDTVARPKPSTPAGATDPGGLRFLVVTDNLAAPAAGNAHVRFFHLAPGAPAVWVTVSGGTLATGDPVVPATLFANRAYRVASTGSGATAVNFANFTPVPAGTYNLEVRTGSATGPVALSVPDVPLSAGKIYTLYANGRPRNTATPLAAGIIVHN